MTVKLANNALVLGASMGGLMAARVLADVFERVTVVERDRFPEYGEQRKGVPQGRHAHGLLAGGLSAMERLFPGLRAALIARGAQSSELGTGNWIIAGHRLKHFGSDLQGVCCSRPMLESEIRARVCALPNVQIRQGYDILGLKLAGETAVAARVIGRADGACEELLHADLVVDAMGRGSKLPVWLQEHGYEPPNEQRVRIDVGYVSALYRRRPGQLNDVPVLIVAAAPPNRRCGVALAIDDEHWLVTLPGYFGDHAQSTASGMLEFAKTLPAPDMYELLASTEQASAVVSAKFPYTQRRHYARLRKHPEGLVAFGDALCSFNPILGQGMTVCALEAEALAASLTEGTRGLWRRFYARADAVIETPWSTAVNNDLRFPETAGERGAGWRLLDSYAQALLRAASADPVLSERFMRVTHMLDKPTALVAPGIVGRVATSALRRRFRQTATPGARLELPRI
jgi:2-polyprenyl-6-methoxyphenol hydroxylase-like FAD-dependent oxidoreductase